MNGSQFQDRKRIDTYRLRFLQIDNFYPCPSDTIKHFLESSKPGSSELTLNAFILQVSTFI